MAKLYYEYIKAGKRTLESVPKRWHDAVAAMLAEDEKNGEQEG